MTFKSMERLRLNSPGAGTDPWEKRGCKGMCEKKKWIWERFAENTGIKGVMRGSPCHLKCDLLPCNQDLPWILYFPKTNHLFPGWVFRGWPRQQGKGGSTHHDFSYFFAIHKKAIFPQPLLPPNICAIPVNKTEMWDFCFTQTEPQQKYV